jgi:hypothetical protein
MHQGWRADGGAGAAVTATITLWIVICNSKIETKSPVDEVSISDA